MKQAGDRNTEPKGTPLSGPSATPRR